MLSNAVRSADALLGRAFVFKQMGSDRHPYNVSKCLCRSALQAEKIGPAKPVPQTSEMALFAFRISESPRGPAGPAKPKKPKP